MLDLDHVERLIRNPPSASLPSEMLLALVDECRALRARLLPVEMLPAHMETSEPVADAHAAPTPPAAPAAKRKAHK